MLPGQVSRPRRHQEPPDAGLVLGVLVLDVDDLLQLLQLGGVHDDAPRVQLAAQRQRGLLGGGLGLLTGQRLPEVSNLETMRVCICFYLTGSLGC